MVQSDQSAQGNSVNQCQFFWGSTDSCANESGANDLNALFLD